MIVLILVCISLLALDYDNGLASVHRAVGSVAGPIERGVDDAARPVGNFFQGLPHVGSQRATIERLRAEDAALEARLAASGLDAARSAALGKIDALASAASGAGHRVVPAKVIDLGGGLGFEWTVRLNVGSASGVKVGMTVIAAEGLVGRVKEVDPATSVVLLADDPQSSVGVRVQRTGKIGILTGEGQAPMSYTGLDARDKPKVGDRLLTGPTGDTSFVADVPVGVVTGVHDRGSAPPAVSVRPYVDPTSLDVLGVIIDLPNVSGTPVRAGAGQ